MQPKILLRIAAAAITLFALGHTVGGMILFESHGPEEDALLAQLAAYRFDMMGTMRSHADFYEGEGWYLSATLIMLIVLTWQLSNAVVDNPKLVGRMALVIATFFAVSAALCAKFFFGMPLLMSLVAALACGAAWWRLRGA
jgi:hypothetical protein